MRWLRFWEGEQITYGIERDGEVVAVSGSPFGAYSEQNKAYPTNEVLLLTPCEPSKVLCIGLNYRDHAEEVKLELPDEPVVFMKPSTTVIGSGQKIICPSMSKRVDYEGELAVVIGQMARNVPEAEAKHYILGYTCGNDVTARDLQPKNGQWTVSKSFDTFCPLGPVIETEVDPGKLDIKLLLNDEVKQSSNTAQMIFSPAYLLSYLSRIMTLYPGDVILTGTPGGIGAVKPGDEVTVEIEGIGRLSNPVVGE